MRAGKKVHLPGRVHARRVIDPDERYVDWA
jgi:hypothetical protein